MSTDNVTTNTVTPQDTDAKNNKSATLGNQISNAEFALKLLKAFPQDQYYLLDVRHFAKGCGMSDIAFVKRFQRLNNDHPELQVFKCTMNPKDVFTIVPKPKEMGDVGEDAGHMKARF